MFVDMTEGSVGILIDYPTRPAASVYPQLSGIVSPNIHVCGSSSVRTPCLYHQGAVEALPPTGWVHRTLKRWIMLLADIW